MADLGLAQLHDMKTNAEMIAGLDPYGPPLIADMDTGYGGMSTLSTKLPYPKPQILTTSSMI
jgi:methylisocitrate lyase